jgi:hypothetical protein
VLRGQPAALRPLLVLCLPLLAAGVVSPLGADSRQRQLPPDHDGRGALAVLRRDGILFPFASFNRDTWRVTWPTGVGAALEIPATAQAIPKNWWGTRSPDRWQAYLANGEETFLELREPTVFKAFCGTAVGVRTAYRATEPLPPVPVDPFPKDGLAVSGGVPVESIETVSPDSPEWAPLTASLLDEFNEVEKRTVDGVRRFARWRHPVPDAARRTTPIRLEAWYRAPSGEPGWTTSYVELARQFAPREEDNGCGLETLVSGWVHHRNGTLSKKTQLTAKLTYCDRVGARYMLPFGRIRPRDQTYWVFQLSGWESEWYEVVSVRPEKVRYALEVLAGRGTRCR